MNKNFRLKEISDWIKRSLKNKLSITKNFNVWSFYEFSGSKLFRLVVFLY